MKLQAIISSVALAAALTFSGASYAQSMIGGVEIPADRADDFKAACEALRAQSTASLSTDDTDDVTTGSTASANDSAQSDSPDPAAKDNWDELLVGLTIEQCDEGFPAAM